MSEPLTFWLPKPPDNANGRKHWGAANREKTRYVAELVKRAMLRHGMPPLPSKPLARATITAEWHYPDGRWHLDDDNAIRRLKPALDFLVTHGYLAKDSPDVVKWAGIEHVVGQPTPPLCTVRLTITPR